MQSLSLSIPPRPISPRCRRQHITAEAASPAEGRHHFAKQNITPQSGPWKEKKPIQVGNSKGKTPSLLSIQPLPTNNSEFRIPNSEFSTDFLCSPHNITTCRRQTSPAKQHHLPTGHTSLYEAKHHSAKRQPRTCPGMRRSRRRRMRRHRKDETERIRTCSGSLKGAITPYNGFYPSRG